MLSPEEEEKLTHLVATKVMGWAWGQTGADYCGWSGAKFYGQWDPRSAAHYGRWYPATNLNHAFELVTKLDLPFTLGGHGDVWICSIGLLGLPVERKTPALAICHAALLCVN